MVARHFPVVKVARSSRAMVDFCCSSFFLFFGPAGILVPRGVGIWWVLLEGFRLVLELPKVLSLFVFLQTWAWEFETVLLEGIVHIYRTAGPTINNSPSNNMKKKNNPFHATRPQMQYQDPVAHYF